MKKEPIDFRNALTEIACNFSKVMEDGYTGKEPFFNAILMKELAIAKAKELEALPQFDLSTEAGRKELKAAIRPIKQLFADFETNIKVIKKATSDIPKKCDASSKTVRDIAEPAIAKAELPLKLLKQQEEQAQRWWKKEKIPFDKYRLERLLNETAESEPLPYSTEAEKADFEKHKSEYAKALKEAIGRIDAAEKAEREEKERLRKQAEEQAAEAKRQREAQAKLEAEARRQREELAKLEAEKKAIAEAEAKVKAEAEELERQKRQSAVNPAPTVGNESSPPAGAPPANAELSWEASTIVYEAEQRLKSVIANMDELADSMMLEADSAMIACNVIAAIRDCQIPHVRFVYE